jgi:hypothetical protein
MQTFRVSHDDELTFSLPDSSLPSFIGVKMLPRRRVGFYYVKLRDS